MPMETGNDHRIEETLMPQECTEFDFLCGQWAVENHRLQEPLTGSSRWYDAPATAVSRTQHGGTISIDEMWFPELQFAGTSFRTRATNGEWTIHWVSSTAGIVQPPVVGRWDAAGTLFEATGPDHYNGRHILARYLWHSITLERAIWEQAFSTDGGASWETNWVMNWQRLSGRP